MANILDYIKPHSTMSISKGEQRYYPAEGYMFVIRLNDDTYGRIHEIVYRSMLDWEITGLSGEGFDLEYQLFTDIPIEVWSKIHQQ